MARQKIPQLRIALNSICGKHCSYCRPSGELAQPVTQQMAPSETLALARLLSGVGVRHIKLTGGDPGLYRHIVWLVKQLKETTQCEHLELVTRHPRCGRLAEALRDAGLDLLNFSLDSLDAAVWTSITGVRGHAQLLAAIRNAAAARIPVKISMVVLRGINDQEIGGMIEFCRTIGARLKLLDLITDIGALDIRADYAAAHYDDLSQTICALKAKAVREWVEYAPGGLGHPMPTFELPDVPLVQVKTRALGGWYGDICSGCPMYPCDDALMALRLTPDGKLQRCLARSDNLIDILGPLRAGRTESYILKRIDDALSSYRSATFHRRAVQRDLAEGIVLSDDASTSTAVRLTAIATSPASDHVMTIRGPDNAHHE